MNKKRAIAAGICICITVVICATVFGRKRPGDITLLNAAQETVVHAIVQINGTTFQFDNIPPAGVRKIKYPGADKNRYSVNIEFRYERKLPPQTGIFSDRGKEQNQLVIKRDEVVLESGG
ncbi:MAG TPA: hypothetical protein VG733_17050 [Chthoniobacteraceae bacterium]|nr:hypothetical protein [Chthoniobacteraceae bacterium]